MIEEISKNIYRIGIFLAGSPLRELNTYLIRRDGKEILIDAGYRTEDCERQLTEALARLGCDRNNLTVALTHLHSDHAALSPVVAGKNGGILIGKKDLEFGRLFYSGALKKDLTERMSKDGLPTEEFIGKNAVEVEAPDFSDTRFRGLDDGEVVTIGDSSLQLVSVPGHTPGNAMYWMEKEKILFTGDHVLYDITPNITAFPGCGDLLGEYLLSLRRADEIRADIALPAHRGITGDYHGRIRTLLKHHEKRLSEVEGIVKNNPGLTPYGIASMMTWRIHAKSWKEFPNAQKWFAMGECQAHLDHLENTGKVKKISTDTRYNRYEPV